MNVNIEIFNFLNVINPNLGEFYKKTGHNPLPRDFLPTKNDIKEVLLLNQIEIPKTPNFVFANKRIIKKIFKNYYKNSKKLAAEIENSNKISAEFAKKLKIYLNLQEILTHILLKKFRQQDFNEVDAFKQIVQTNPILAEKFITLFDEKPAIDFEHLEEKYFALYNEKIKLIEKKNNKKAKQENNKILLENSKKTIKKVEKTAKNIKKLQNKQDVKKVKKQIKSNKVKEK